MQTRVIKSDQRNQRKCLIASPYEGALQFAQNNVEELNAKTQHVGPKHHLAKDLDYLRS